MRAAGCAVALLLAFAAREARVAPARPRVKTTSGTLEGVSTDGATPFLAFKGIPYAASPAGAERWKPPTPAAPWTAVRNAADMGPSCPQADREPVLFRRLTTTLGGDPSWVPPLGATSEDCLSLNVFTARLGSAARRPVLVWIHGGANRFGSGKDQASALVRHGAVVVTFNYRLGLLGFLAHPALGAESPHRSSGNYALLDQIAALRWVRHNIDAFGGDPDRVTVFGHSAGGDAIAQLLASPLAKGLFHRAVIQSGGLGTARPRGEMEAEGLKVAGALGVPPADPLPALRALPVDALLAASAPFDAVVDGWVVPEPGPGVLSSGHGRTIPLLVGATRDEANVFALPRDPESHRAAVEETGAAWKDRVAALYPAGDDALPRLMTDRDFVCPARYVAARRRGSTWLYLFSSPPTPGPGGTSLGAFHGADVRALFDLTYGLPRNASEQRIGDAMRRYWVHFAATGNPNPPGLPTWPRYEGPEPAHLQLDDPMEVRAGLGRAGCDLFDRMWDAAFAPPPGG